MSSREESEEKAGKENNEVEDLEAEKKKMVNVTDPGLVEKGTGDNSGVVSDFLMFKKEVKWCKALLGLRIATFVFCFNAFSVLAAANQKVLDENPLLMPTYQLSAQTQYSLHWYHYAEFKYSFAANVIGFVFSVFQICGLLRYLITKKHTVNPKLQGYFNVAMDQVLAFVLMSASSTAATRASVNKSYWVEHGGLKFIDMASASVALSFLAFVAFSFSSLVSCFILCRFSK